MPDKTIEDVPAACAELYKNALGALERKEPLSAISDLLRALELEPGFSSARQLLRRAATEEHLGGGTGLIANLSLAPPLIWATLLAHLRPLKALSIAERVLLKDPCNIRAHKIVAQAASALGYPETAVLSLRVLAKKQRISHHLRIQLAQALAQSGETSDAAMLYGRMLKDNPDDPTVLKDLRNLSQRKMADAFQVKHVHSSPPVTSIAQASPDDQIRRYEPIVSHCPKNTKVLLTLAGAYDSKQVFEKALYYYQRALAVEPKNIEIRKAMDQIILRKFDFELSHLDKAASDYTDQREKLQSEKLEFERTAAGWPE